MSSADDEDIVAWEDCVTDLPQGFTALRLETNWLCCSAEEGLADVGTEAQRACTGHAVHLLCRALGLAPPSYRSFFLMAADRHAQLTVTGGVSLDDEDVSGPDYDRDAAAHFGSVAGLAAAMRQYADAEGLSARLSADEQSVVVRRNDKQSLGGAADVQ